MEFLPTPTQRQRPYVEGTLCSSSNSRRKRAGSVGSSSTRLRLTRNAFVVVQILAFGGVSLGEESGRFARHVAPIFQKHCLGCHNESDRKGDFSLQTKASAFADGFISPGDTSASHLLALLTPVSGKSQMPRNAAPLARHELDIIREWIGSGAEWPESFVVKQAVVDDFDWWSYRPINRPTPPNTSGNWARTPIDAFVSRKHRELKLTPAPEADRRTLIRRLTFDLIGLPPTPEEVAAFVNDSGPKAYERLVNRLLNSTHYGERWARHWLDVVKYADTCGYDKDKLRPNAWPYRDYVIRAFNDDKPYSRFVQEQIAGDVLFPGEPDGILGLGFIAAGPWDFIGHVEVSESKIDGKVARNLDRDDMVSNAMNTFCSVTVQCARCHNHKFDPITQEDYYGLQSIFAAVDKADRPYDLDPEIETRRREIQTKTDALKQELTKASRRFFKVGGTELEAIRDRLSSLRAEQAPTPLAEYGYHSRMAERQDATKWVEIVFPEAVVLREIIVRPAHDDFGGIGAGFGFPVRFTVDVLEEQSSLFSTVADHTQVDFPNPGLNAFRIGGLNVRARKVRVTATKLADRKGPFNFALAEIEAFDEDGNNIALKADVNALDSIEAGPRWRKSNLTDGLWPAHKSPMVARQLANARKAYDRILAQPKLQRIAKQREQLSASIAALEKKLKAIPSGKLVYAAATQFKARSNFKPTQGRLRPVRVLHRGEILQPGKEAVPCVLPLSATRAATMPRDLDEGQRRATLARWLTRPDHPLVWRSIVNRVWQYHFGQGLVATPNDFGHMGAEPTHPQLLDWLACEFRESQSFKELHRLLVTSSVYRQSSDHNERNSAFDSGNQYLWRMNRRRLEAEEIRDAILAVSGTLQTKQGGPGFYLFELEKTQHSPHYEYHKFDPADETTHRRSIYRFIVRSQPDPWMTTLDCADSSQSTPKRTETLTSLQALSLLNNRFNLYMAERFAERLGRLGEDPVEQIVHAMQLVAQRQPTPDELVDLTSYASEHGLANACRLFFNLSEFVYLD